MTRETLKTCEKALYQSKYLLEKHLEKISLLDDESQKEYREEIKEIEKALEEIRKECKN